MQQHAHDVFEILMMSVALGMDAFSLTLGMGMQGIRRQRAIQLACLIGGFHVLFTLAGIWVGQMLGDILGHVAQWFGAMLLIGLGLHMLYSTLFVKQTAAVNPALAALILFSAGVSVDALSVGFSLGLRSTAYGIISAISFGIFAGFLCAVGALVGKRANQLVGSYGEFFGSIILIGYGLHFLVG